MTAPAEDFDGERLDGYMRRVVSDAVEQYRDDDAEEATAAPLSVDYADFLARDIPPTRWLVDRLLEDASGNMVHAWRGTGKSFFIMELARAVATGTAFHKWEVPEAAPVLLVDGELSAAKLQERLGYIDDHHAERPEPGMFNIVCKLDLPDRVRAGFKIGDRDAQKRIEDELARTGAKLLILDSLTTLHRNDHPENTAEWFAPVQEWELDLRPQGITTVFSAHDGKGKVLRGTSKMEDTLSTVLHLRHPPDHDPTETEGAAFEMHFSKWRDIYGADLAGVSLTYERGKDGLHRWLWFPLGEEVQLRKLLELVDRGMTQRQIAEEVGKSAAWVNGKLRKARRDVQG